MEDDSKDRSVPATQAYRDAEGRPHLVEEQEEAARAPEQAEHRRRDSFAATAHPAARLIRIS